MEKAFEVWSWSAAVLARSLLPIVVLAAFLGLWALAAYEWLWIPESSIFVLMLSFVWAIAQLLAAAAVLAGTVTSAVRVADANAQALYLPFSMWFGRTHQTSSSAFLIGFSRKHFAASFLWLIAASVIGLALAEVFAWVNQRSIEVASFLTFHSGKPVSYLMIDKCITAIEWLIWIAVTVALLDLLMVFWRSGWQPARRQFGRVLTASCFGRPFLSGFLSVLVFGGLAYLLALWRPTVPAGFWDYTQLVLRVVVVLTLVAAGWLFWLLCLARLSSRTEAAS